MMELRLKHPDATFALDLSVQDEAFRLYHSKQLGIPRPESIHTPTFTVYAKFIERAVGNLKYVWKPETQSRITLNRKLSRPRNKLVWRTIRQAVLHSLHVSATAASGCVYVTRRHAKKRVLHEEDALVAVLTEVCSPRPLIVVAMETLEFSEQVAIMVNASTVFLERGAAMAFTVFLTNGAHLVYIDGPEDSTWMVTTTDFAHITRVVALTEYDNFAAKLHVNVGLVKEALSRAANSAEFTTNLKSRTRSKRSLD